MATPDPETVLPDGASGRSLHTPSGSIHEPNLAPETPNGPPGVNGSATSPRVEKALPATPSKSQVRRVPTTTPRLKKKVPWNGKNIMVLLPRDDQRGKPDEAPIPLNQAEIFRMLNSWQELGYDTRGFDLASQGTISAPIDTSQSRDAWPSPEDLARERAERSIKITLPDLNAWKNHVEELNEAKLRALGVSFGDDEPPPPSISPASTMSRQASVAHYPPLPFSPPLPTSSASSNHAQFPFPGQFVPGAGTSAAQSPGIPTVASPASFAAKYNPRASISIPSPHAWSPQMLLQQGLARGGSPALANLNALVSPSSPLPADVFQVPMAHQRHQSLQYPLLPHQLQQGARASPRLQELREVDEEVQSKSPSKTPEPTQAPFMRHNASASLQKEIDEAEYHLEEQFRSQLEHDEDYSPHNEEEKPAAPSPAKPETSHAREPSVQFASQSPRLGEDSDHGPVLHHPQPHSRGHSLSQKYFTESDEMHDGTDEDPPRKPPPLDTRKADESYEIETNPSNLGTPVQTLDFGKMLHQRSFSTASNPWSDVPSQSVSNPGGPRRPSHGSKPSLSKLNPEASDFRFNPARASTFVPGQFVFSSNTFQPTAFQAGSAPHGLPSMARSFTLPAAAPSKINVNAPAFSPGQSDFSFSSSGPKFRPDAPAFTPLHSGSGSVTSPLSGSDSAGRRTSSIFGNIDLNSPDIVKPARKSKAIPIVPPAKQESPRPGDGIQDGPDGRLVDESRVKRVRGARDDDQIALFAEPGDPVNVAEQPAEANDEAAKDRLDDDDNAAQGDTTLSSTIVSETTDTKDSPLQTSPDQRPMNWMPFEFKNQVDIQSFNDARPFGEDNFKRQHKKTLSATARSFFPGDSSWVKSDVDEPVDFGDEEPLVEPRAKSAEELSKDAADEAVEHEPGSAVEPVAAVESPKEPSAGSTEAQVSRSPAAESPKEPSAGSTEAQVSRSPAATPSPEELSSNFAFAPPSPAPRGLASSRFAVDQSTPRKPSGLSASRFATAPPPVPDGEPRTPELSGGEQAALSPVERDDTRETIPVLESPPDRSDDGGERSGLPELHPGPQEELTYDEIDAVMRHLGENPNMGVKKNVAVTQWHQPSPTRHISLAAVTDSSPLHLPPQGQFRSDAPSPSPRRHHPLPGEVPQPMPSTELEDPFVDPPQSARSIDGAVHNLNTSESLPASDWEGAFSDDEHVKLESRVNFFDGHVNELVGGLLASRLGPMEKTLEGIQHALASMSRRTPSSRRDRRSMSAEVRESDADDEDDEMPVPRRSTSPRRDRRMEQIRTAVLDALSTQLAAKALQTPAPAPQPQPVPVDNTAVLQALEEMKEQFGQSLHLDFRGEDLRNIVEDAVERRMPATPKPVLDAGLDAKVGELQARVVELEQKLRLEETKSETEINTRRAAEDRAAEIQRRLELAETRVEVEIMNKSAFDQRVTDLEDKLRHQEEKTEEEVHMRRSAEDRLSEVQRLLRISSEEETRLREAVDEKEQKIKSIEETRGKSTMRLALLEAAQTNAAKNQSELQNRINMAEVDLRDARQEARHWKAEAERVEDLSRRHGDDLARALDENKQVHKLIDTLGTQLRETERVREGWRAKFLSLQQDMAQAAREITEENARRTKKEQALVARQEVLDAKLQAEARTRERLETEIERLEGGERQGMRAVNECKRLETLLGELRTENHKLQQTSMRYQAEFQEARESGAREVQRTRESMQTEVEDANHQVNVVREELEDHISRLQSQLDQVRVDSETARARHDMLLEEIESTKKTEVEVLTRKHQNEVEDLQARYERQLSNTVEDAQRSEQNLLERLRISNSKSEHLQDRVAHLEERLEIAKEAALAAAQAAKSASAEPTQAATAAPEPRPVPRSMQLPEKISPQALRESIMVLQEQLQEREQRIEELEHALAKVDPEAPTKIAKRDDEITWLRELLAVRHSDLHDIITALARDDFDKDAVKDAAIRLKANLQMEEQERERAMNGGSAINLPNIAATIRDAATPRVAQAVGPLAAAWGNWRKSRDPAAFGSFSSVLSTPATGGSANATPSRSSPASQSSFLSGLLTPPASGLRQTPPATSSAEPSQPTAFSSTGRRYTAQQLASRPRGPSGTSRQSEKAPMRGTPPRKHGRGDPVTPPMMRPSAYDSDAHAGEFDDADFFNDE